MPVEQKVEPALTAHEWAQFLDPSGDWVEYYLDRDDEHTIAALALYGQPFGFTQFDVNKLRSIAATIEGENDAPLTAARVRDIADRIAALLPPQLSKAEGDGSAGRYSKKGHCYRCGRPAMTDNLGSLGWLCATCASYE